MTADNEQIEIDVEQYNMLRDAHSQCVAEQWFPVLRRDEEPVSARPVDRQDDASEGGKTTSSAWLIRETNGDTYTVSDETFEEKYDEQNTLRTEEFAVDLSWDAESTETDDGDVVDIDGWTVVATVAAIIDVRTQSVISFDVTSVDLRQDNYQNMDGIPLELLYDSPIFNRIEDVTQEQDDE